MNSATSAKEGIEQLFHLYASDVYRFARYLAPSGVDAKDVVQEVFLRAFRKWNGQSVSNPKAWLLQITRNYIFDLLRRKKCESHYKEKHKPDLTMVSVPLDTLIELEEAVSALKPDYRQVFMLRCVHDLSVEETAQVLGWSRAKVRTSLHRAITKLRVALGPERFDSPQPLKKVGDPDEPGRKSEGNVLSTQ
ncbi:RNA polymerase sigma factor [Alicyclobacillus fastidiosus]|uniref:RNA polymerase sigma factor n=1 Tax=Alicyclobacillus fastidiosus TaxID=392011 RepID=A0ABY6ZA83_9BACL|nr:RNA polymerase sigma factor [Alicyclobacillus fastidiosus]WAH39795.1 RNA polymerase sigma factor [Alicyclobacillus fastidiosus]